MSIDNPSIAFGATFYRMEVDRVKYSVGRYLRARLMKIEQQAEFIVENDVVKDKLSIQERVFVDKLTAMNAQHFRTCVHDAVTTPSLKKHMAKRADIIQNAMPDLMEFVICLAMDDINDIIIGTLTNCVGVCVMFVTNSYVVILCVVLLDLWCRRRSVPHHPR